MTEPRRFRVVIVGAGFAGLEAARTLARSQVEVLLIDRNNYHTFLPLLHQVAAAVLEPEQVAYPIRSFLRHRPNVQFRLAKVKGINLTEQVVETESSLVPYDFLIVAVGSTAQFLGVPGAKEHAIALKTLRQAVALHDHILRCFEQAVQEPDPQRRQQLLTFVIVGGGPTGVEFAGALAELIHRTLVKYYSTLDFGQVRIVLLHSRDNLLNTMPRHLRIYAQTQLSLLGVEVLLQTRVVRVTKELVQLQDDRVIYTETVVWVAGVRGNLPGSQWGLPTTSRGKVEVLPTLQVPGYANTYVIGDSAGLEQDGRSLPTLAAAAMQQGKVAAQNILRQIRGQIPLPFQYQHKGTMAIIGRHAAVAQVGRFTFTGFLAWLLWLGVHIVLLRGTRNRLITLLNWISSYCCSERVAHLILNSEAISTEE